MEITFMEATNSYLPPLYFDISVKTCSLSLLGWFHTRLWWFLTVWQIDGVWPLGTFRGSGTALLLQNSSGE
jgi:hypothetical protein